MDYQVWTKDEYGDEWSRVDCGDLEAARSEIDKAIRKGAEPLLTVEVPYTINIKVSEVGVEAPKGKTKPGKDTRVESESEIRSGDDGPVSEHDQATGDNKPSDNVPGR